MGDILLPGDCILSLLTTPAPGSGPHSRSLLSFLKPLMWPTAIPSHRDLYPISSFSLNQTAPKFLALELWEKEMGMTQSRFYTSKLPHHFTLSPSDHAQGSLSSMRHGFIWCWTSSHIKFWAKILKWQVFFKGFICSLILITSLEKGKATKKKKLSTFYQMNPQGSTIRHLKKSKVFSVISKIQ